jgi:hypothetical protein
MTYRDFVYFLQGYFELSNATSLTQEQLVIIRNHLNLTLATMEPTQGTIEWNIPGAGKPSGPDGLLRC